MTFRHAQGKRMLITGGAGFIGINAAEYFRRRGYRVSILDNFSRPKVEANLKWLKARGGAKVEVIRADVARDMAKLNKAAGRADVILHLAGQTAVTTSVEKPRDDFMNNALGTFNVLETARLSRAKPFVIYASTNKVYGGLEGVPNLRRGVSEKQPIDFHSPYGCSKGAADQYVRDYARIYNLDTVVFRQSCIYGPHQFGIEDQGWVAWFTIAATLGRAITIYGNGKQVRDILYVDDLCRAYELAIKNRKKVSGQILNIGGGPANTMSLLEFLPMLPKVKYKFDQARPGDQPIYVSDIGKARRVLGWRPKVGVREGIKKLTQWVRANKKEF